MKKSGGLLRLTIRQISNNQTKSFNDLLSKNRNTVTQTSPGILEKFSPLDKAKSLSEKVANDAIAGRDFINGSTNGISRLILGKDKLVHMMLARVCSVTETAEQGTFYTPCGICIEGQTNDQKYPVELARLNSITESIKKLLTGERVAFQELAKELDLLNTDYKNKCVRIVVYTLRAGDTIYWSDIKNSEDATQVFVNSEQKILLMEVKFDDNGMVQFTNEQLTKLRQYDKPEQTNMIEPS